MVVIEEIDKNNKVVKTLLERATKKNAKGQNKKEFTIGGLKVNLDQMREGKRGMKLDKVYPVFDVDKKRIKLLGSHKTKKNAPLFNKVYDAIASKPGRERKAAYIKLMSQATSLSEDAVKFMYDFANKFDFDKGNNYNEGINLYKGLYEPLRAFKGSTPVGKLFDEGKLLEEKEVMETETFYTIKDDPEEPIEKRARTYDQTGEKHKGKKILKQIKGKSLNTRIIKSGEYGVFWREQIWPIFKEDILVSGSNSWSLVRDKRSQEEKDLFKRMNKMDADGAQEEYYRFMMEEKKIPKEVIDAALEAASEIPQETMNKIKRELQKNDRQEGFSLKYDEGINLSVLEINKPGFMARTAAYITGNSEVERKDPLAKKIAQRDLRERDKAYMKRKNNKKKEGDLTIQDQNPVTGEIIPPPPSAPAPAPAPLPRELTNDAQAGTGEAPPAKTDKQCLIEDMEAQAPSRPTGTISAEEQLLMNQENEQRDAIFDIQPPAPPSTTTQATLQPTQEELQQRQKDLATDVQMDTGTILDEDNIPEIGIQQTGISAIAVKLGYDFTYYKDIVEKQSPPSKDEATRKKELEICIKEYGAFIPIIEDSSYKSVLEVYTLKYIYNENLRFDRKWKMSLINSVRNISQQNMMSQATGTGTGLAVSLETMGISAEEAIKRLSSSQASQQPQQQGSNSNFRMSQTTGRMPFASTGRTGERGQPIYDMKKAAKPGGETTTVPPLSRQVKGDVEKEADKKPPVIPNEYKDFIMRYDRKKQQWVKVGRRPKPTKKQYKARNIKLKIEKPMRFNSNHLYTNLGKYDPPEAGNNPVFRTRNSTKTSNRFAPNYGV